MGLKRNFPEGPLRDRANGRDRPISMRMLVGSRRILLDTPRRVEQNMEEIYSAGEGERSVRVRISPTFCTDPMSGESFPFTVSVDWQGQQLLGCGRALDHPWE